MVMMGLDNGVFYQEDEEEGKLTLPTADAKGTYHVKGSLEVAGAKKIKSLMYECKDIFELYQESKKVIITPMPRWFRKPCCEDRGHCTNMRMPNYRRSMMQDLAELKEAVEDFCMEDGVRRYKVVSGSELVGIKAEMEDDEAGRLLGKDAVHLAPGGYACMAENLVRMVEETKNPFAGEKREREDSQGDGEETVGGWVRKRHEWLYRRISGEGGWRTGRGGRGSLASAGRGAGPSFGRGRSGYLNGKA